MNHFQFATVFSARRKELGVTQEQVAAYIGVSRAAVSKWEKGQSYPDITLLPRLATYFNISIDTLLGYEPQLTEERIVALYAELAQTFATERYEVAAARVEALLAEYYACFPFVLKMAQLYLNYFQQAPELQACMERVQQLCERVFQGSEDYALKNEAHMILAATYMIQGEPQKVLAHLGEDVQVQYGVDQLVASAHDMLGHKDKAKEIMQVSVYQNVLSTISMLTSSMMLHTEEPVYFDETVRRVEHLIGIFNMEEMNANMTLIFRLRAAEGYALQNRVHEALQQLECYVAITAKFDLDNLLKADDYFYLLEGWLKKEMSLSTVTPRDKQSVRRDVVHSVTHNPTFQLLQQEPQFKIICTNLQHQLRGGETNGRN